ALAALVGPPGPPRPARPAGPDPWRDCASCGSRRLRAVDRAISTVSGALAKGAANTCGEGGEAVGRELSRAGENHAVTGVLEQLHPGEVVAPRPRVRTVHVAEVLDQQAGFDIREIRMPVTRRCLDRGLHIG